MPRQRLIWFLGMVALGLLFGLIYGWVLRTPEQTNAEPKNLREDYQADYVLMAAEIFAANADLPAAQARLGALGYDSPAAALQAALATARQLDYAQEDLILLESLLLRVQSEAAP